MAFEIVTHPHLPPNRCAACGCTEAGPYAFIPQTTAWEHGWPFICQKCVKEMSDAMGITLQTVEKEVIKEVEVVRDPTDAEILAVIQTRFQLAQSDALHAAEYGRPPIQPPVNQGAPEYGQSLIEKLVPFQMAANQGAPAQPDQATDETKVSCVCGAEFTGSTAKAKLGSHKRTCEAAKEAGAHAG